MDIPFVSDGQKFNYRVCGMDISTPCFWRRIFSTCRRCLRSVQSGS